MSLRRRTPTKSQTSLTIQKIKLAQARLPDRKMAHSRATKKTSTSASAPTRKEKSKKKLL